MYGVSAVTVWMMIVMVSGVSAQSKRESDERTALRMERAKMNTLMGLRSNNDGLTESAAMLIAKIAMRYPDLELRDQQSVLDSVGRRSSSEQLRYKAYLSTQICIDPVWFADDSVLTHADGDHFFLQAAQRLQQKVFGMK